MKVAAACTVALAALCPLVTADFSIWRQSIGGNGISGNARGWQVYANNPGAPPGGCGNAKPWIWRASSDVSGGKYGVRCGGDGDSCSENDGVGGGGINQLEFNTRENGGDTSKPHFTYYKNRGGAIVNLNNKQIGTCTPAGGKSFACGIAVGQAIGSRKLNCVSSLTPADFPQPA